MKLTKVCCPLCVLQIDGMYAHLKQTHEASAAKKPAAAAPAGPAPA
jgi:hypothetical protein